MLHAVNQSGELGTETPRMDSYDAAGDPTTELVGPQSHSPFGNPAPCRKGPETRSVALNSPCATLTHPVGALPPSLYISLDRTSTEFGPHYSPTPSDVVFPNGTTSPS